MNSCYKDEAVIGRQNNIDKAPYRIKARDFSDTLIYICYILVRGYIKGFVFNYFRCTGIKNILKLMQRRYYIEHSSIVRLTGQ